MKSIEQIKTELERKPGRSAWDKGVTLYALELIDGLEQAITAGYVGIDDLESSKLLERAMLDGAADWSQYSWGGCSLVYNCDIAARLCTKTELKRTHNGARRPNANEEWLDTQARALYQAAERIKRIAYAKPQSKPARTYVCVVSAANCSDHEYTVTTRSAVKAAYMYGNANDCVSIYTQSGKEISAAMWDIESRKYVRICI